MLIFIISWHQRLTKWRIQAPFQHLRKVIEHSMKNILSDVRVERVMLTISINGAPSSTLSISNSVGDFTWSSCSNANSASLITSKKSFARLIQLLMALGKKKRNKQTKKKFWVPMRNQTLDLQIPWRHTYTLTSTRHVTLKSLSCSTVSL